MGAGGTNKTNDERLMEDSQKTAGVSAGLGEQLKQLTAIATSTSEYWEDVAQTEFMQRYEEYKKSLTEQIDYLQKLSEKMEKYARKSMETKQEGKQDFAI